MPILFGWGKTTVRDHGDCIAASCPRCHNSIVLRHVLLTVWFTLFFIPLIPYKRRRMLVCPICNWSREVPKEAIVLTDEMTAITAQWRAGTLPADDYERRVAAYWSFQTGGAQPPASIDAITDHPDAITDVQELQDPPPPPPS